MGGFSIYIGTLCSTISFKKIFRFYVRIEYYAEEESVVRLLFYKTPTICDDDKHTRLSLLIVENNNS
jgi:hypothetical protein